MPFAAPPPPLPPPPPVVFTGARPDRQRVALADRRTLRPSGRSARLPAAGLGFERSPDGTRLAVLGLRESRGGVDEGYAVSVLDVAGWRTQRSVRLGQSYGGFAWVRDDRLLLVGDERVRVLDPSTLHRVRDVALPGEVLTARQVGDRLALVVVGRDDRPPRLVVLDAEGATATDVALPFADLDAAGLVDLEADPVTGRVRVAGGVSTVLEIDPATAAVTDRSLPGNRSFPLEWRGPRVLAGDTFPRTGGARPTLRTIAEDGAVGAPVRLARGTELARGSQATLGLAPRSVTAFGPAGERLWTRRTSRRPQGLVAAGRAYVVAGRRTVVLDAATGRRVATARPLPATRLVATEADGTVFSPLLVARGRPGS